jgi:hypothetical protein
MKKIVVDTSIIIDFLRSNNKQNSLLYKLAEEDLYISIVTHTELYAGKSIWVDNEAKESLEKVLSGMSLVTLDKRISERAGYIKSYSNISLIDALIASTALIGSMELMTLNIKDFEKVKGLKIFKSSQL